jgi:outer membrane protein assembly factor BamA
MPRRWRASEDPWRAVVARRLLLAGLVWWSAPAVAAAQVGDYVGLPISAVRLQTEGRDVLDQALADLVETRVGEPLSMQLVRESIGHFITLGRFEDVQVHATRSAASVELVYDLMPLHAVDRVRFEGDLGLSESVLRRELADRFGATPPIGRAQDAARALEELYRTRGFLTARVTPRGDVDHTRERTTLVFTTRAGQRARVGKIDVAGTPLLPGPQLLQRLGISSGALYDPLELVTRLSEYEESLRGRGYYEATADYAARPGSDGSVVDLDIHVESGPMVSIVFEGDPLPEDRQEELVPVRQEASVDEDLLEDSTNRITDYLRSQGYWRASAEHARTTTEAGLRITFRIRRGLLYRVAGLEVSGYSAVELATLQALVSVRAGAPFVEAQLDADVAAIESHYRTLGFAAVQVRSTVEEVPAGPGREPLSPGEGLLAPRIAIVEGPRTLVGSARVEGNQSIPEAQLREGFVSVPGSPFYQPHVTADRETLMLRYLNRGFQSATVNVETVFSSDRSRVDLVYKIAEGPQVIVDHILIVGNSRTSAATIERELLFKPGQPLGLSDFVESQRRLRALGLFRRVRINENAHAGSARRDIIVIVEEAPVTTMGYGGGLEGGRRLRRDPAADGQAVERLEFAPRGFFEVGRRNLWGKNRSVNLFTRVSLRPRDVADDPALDGQGIGFSEYRLLGTYREPHAFGLNADAAFQASWEQAIRSSFNFARRGVQASIARRLSPTLSVTGRYAFDRTRLFNRRFNPQDELLIDRLFPQVRLSSFQAALVRDTRDDPIDPTAGTLVGADGEIAARAIGSEVGFARSFLQAFYFRRLYRSRPIVLATGARLGLEAGFPREVVRVDSQGNPVVGPDGQPIVDVLKDIPASERFFAGGDTTVRGFALDTLGDAPTIDQDGFPKGGHALVILNAELRIPVWRELSFATFLDAGNVFARATDLDLAGIRGAAGFGVRYRSPLGPIRVDLGFKLDEQELSGGGEERRTHLHISLGHAF